jgi:Rieske Fe-S protein
MSAYKISRQEFVKAATAILGSVIGVFIGLPGIGYLIGPGLEKIETNAWIDLGILTNFTPGIPQLFNFNRSLVNGWEKTVISHGVYVLRGSGEQVRVFSNVCTHLACRVSWKPDLQHYVSPCHNGHFDITGNVLSGPPPRPLDEFFLTKVENGRLFIQYPPYQRT